MSLSGKRPFHAASLRLGLNPGYVVILFNILGGKLLQNPYVFGMNAPFVNQQSHEEKLGPLALNKGCCSYFKNGSILFEGASLILCSLNYLTHHVIFFFLLLYHIGVDSTKSSPAKCFQGEISSLQATDAEEARIHYGYTLLNTSFLYGN